MSDDQIDVKVTATIDGLKTGMDQAANAVKDMAAKAHQHGAEAGNAFEIMGEKASGIRHIIEGLSDPVHGLYNDVKELAEAFLVAFAAEKVLEFAEKMAELGAQVLHTTQELGLSGEQVTKLNYAAGAMGVSAESASMGYMRLERSISMATAGNKQSMAAFQAMGVQFKDNEGKARQLDVVLADMANAFQKHADGVEKTAISMAVMGRAGARMIPILNQGAAGFEEMGKKAEQTGTVITTEMAEKMEQTAQKFYELKMAGEGVGIALFERIKPGVDAVVDATSTAIEWFSNFVTHNETLEIALDATGESLKALAELAAALSHTANDPFKGMAVDANMLRETLNDLKAILQAIPHLIVILGGSAVAVFEEFISLAASALIAVNGIGAAILDIVSGDLPALESEWSKVMAAIRYETEATDDRVRELQKTIAEAAHAMANIGAQDKSGMKKGTDWYSKQLDKPEEHEKPKFDNPERGGGAAKKPKKPKVDKTPQRMADEMLQAAEKEAMAEVKIEEDKNNSLYALGQRSLVQMVEIQRNLEQRKYEIALQYLQKRAAADAGDKVQHQKDLDAIRLLEITHKGALAKIEQDYAAKKKQIADQERADAVRSMQDQLKDQIDGLEMAARQGQISEKQRDQQELALTLAVRQQVLARLDADMAGLTRGTKAWEDAHKARQQIVRQFNNDIRKLNDQALTDQMAKWKTFAGTISASVNNSLHGMITGTMGWRQAIGGIIDGVANSFLQMGEKVLANWIETQVLKIAIGKSSAVVGAESEITAAAAVAAANTFASISAIPIIGPALAPEAAAGAYGTVMAMQGLAMASGGMLLDRDQLVFAHQGEQILPAHLSKGIQNIINNGGANAKANLNYSPTINAPASKSLNDLLSDESATMISWLGARMRDGSLGR